ncbi:hypothetical protein QAD02_017008 [Eretmocerus hayati]|uniref:Uncharacterized protein n=1 Tax=Eretmocerus hayati TaxID=131215 RepID=A0ACC2PEJ5_9HYME|nr:hypothetical protein QAD02_017008 [Eretmocerus hayati]
MRRWRNADFQATPDDQSSRSIWFDRTKILDAVSCADYDKVEKLINSGYSVNCSDRRYHSGNTCLHLALKNHDAKMVNILLDAGADINRFNQFGETPLHVHMHNRKGSSSLLKILIDKGADINAVDKISSESESSYPLHEAVKYGSYDAAKYLIENGAHMDVFDVWGRTPLHIASAQKSDFAKLLVESGANVNAVDVEPKPKTNMKRSSLRIQSDVQSAKGLYPLHVAVKSDRLHAVELLIKHGADVDAMDSENRSALYYAVEKDCRDIVSILFKAGARIEVQIVQPISESIEKSPTESLEHAIRMHSTEDAGMACTQRGRSKRARKVVVSPPKTAFDLLLMAVRNGNIDIVEMLLIADEQMNSSSCRDKKTTFLHEALKWGRKNIAELFLKRGVDVNALDDNSKDAMYYAALVERTRDIDSVEYHEILQLLFSYGAVIKDRKNLLRSSILHGNVGTLKLLSCHGLELKELTTWTGEEQPVLCLAARNKNVDVLKYSLRTALFDVNAHDPIKRVTPLINAVQYEHFAHAKILLDWHAESNLPDYNLIATPMHLALMNKLDKFVDLLLFADVVNVVGTKKILTHKSREFILSQARKSRDRTIMQHFIRYGALFNTLHHESNVVFDKNDVLKIFSHRSDPFYREFYDKCIDEISYMKSLVVVDQMTFYDLFQHLSRSSISVLGPDYTDLDELTHCIEQMNFEGGSRLHLAVIVLVGVALGLPAQGDKQKGLQSFDQRQDGNVNVQIDLKDVRVVALIDSDAFDDYSNIDYAYDYADFTIKPKPTAKPKPISTTASPSSPSSPLSNPAPILTILSGGSTSSPKPESANHPDSTATPSVTTQATSASAETASAPAAQPSIQIKPASNISSIESDPIPPISAPPQQINISQVEPAQQPKPEGKPSDSSAVSTSKPTPAEVKPYSAWTHQQHQQEISETNNNANPVVPAVLVDPRRKCPTGFLPKGGKCFKRRLSLISPRLALMKLAPALIRQTKMLTSGIRSSNRTVAGEHH